MPFVLTTEDRDVAVSVKFINTRGNAAEQDTIVWTSSDETIMTVVPAADGQSAALSAVGPPGQADLMVKANVDSVAMATALEVDVIDSQAFPALAHNMHGGWAIIGVSDSTYASRELEKE
jgi:hypothetical protein